MKRLSDKVCMITGAGKGIGASTAMKFAEEGAVVELCDVDVASGNRTTESIRNAGGKASFTETDVTDERSVASWVNEVIDRNGRIDVLFNNAGISAVGRIDEIDRDTWDRVMSVNLTGVYLMCKHVLPIMMNQRKGSVINMSSSVAELGLLRRAAYAATKGAILSMTKSMQVDYAPYNIRINALLPGTIFTPFVQDYLRRSYKRDIDSAIGELKKRQLADSLGDPEDVAWAAVYLASDESKYVMGTGLIVDGGTTCGKPF